ncbi:hypothetical protein U1Q18_019604 [Sarracenia purpurea var. burkii]
MLIEVACRLPVTYASSSLFSMLIDGINWLAKAVDICVPCNHRKFKLSDVEKVLGQYQRIKVSFPLMIDQLHSAIKKHNLWLEQVHLFFNLKPGDRSWILLLELKESGNTDAFNCPVLDMVSSEIQKVEQWKQCCKDIAGTSVGDVETLVHALSELKKTLDRSLHIYSSSKGCKERELCIHCSCTFEDQEFLTCSVCNDWYHLQCKGPTLDDTNYAALYVCRYCHFLESGKISRNGGSPSMLGGKRAELNKLIQLLSDAEDFFVWIEERSILCQMVKRALSCKASLTEVVNFALAYHDEDLSTIAAKLSTAMKAIEAAGVSDHQGNSNFEQALARHSWRVRANKLFRDPQKPVIQQIQRHLKEGLALSIPLEDRFWQKLSDVKQICTQWADKARKVSMDSGALGLDKVFELIVEGENLPVHFEKELTLLRDRSMLYCICRKPYDQRAMIACDRCDEWYHFDCINLSSAPKIYICPACKLQTEDFYSSPTMTLDGSIGSKCEEPQTPSPRHREIRCKSRKPKSIAKRELPVTSDGSNISRRSSGIECLLWRNRKLLTRTARKRSQLESLSPFIYIQK